MYVCTYVCMHLVALNRALAQRGPAPEAQKIIDSLELRGAIYK